jgi:hypothetical protein
VGPAFQPVFGARPVARRATVAAPIPTFDPMTGWKAGSTQSLIFDH